MMQTLDDNYLDADRRHLDSSVSHLWAVLLAGGDGVRLGDLTRRIAAFFEWRVIQDLDAP